MKITIVNGAKAMDYPKENEILNGLKNHLDTNDITIFDISDMDIKPCTGCWTCWLKDPGMCIHDDDMVDVYKSIVKSDLLLFVSTIKAGFIDSQVKKALERQFALLLPHMTSVKGEFHHIPRYDKQAKLGLVIVGEKDHDTEQEEILKEYVYRLSLNFNKATGDFVHYLNAENSKELVNEINNI